MLEDKSYRLTFPSTSTRCCLVIAIQKLFYEFKRKDKFIASYNCGVLINIINKYQISMYSFCFTFASVVWLGSRDVTFSETLGYLCAVLHLFCKFCGKTTELLEGGGGRGGSRTTRIVRLDTAAQTRARL